MLRPFRGRPVPAALALLLIAIAAGAAGAGDADNRVTAVVGAADTGAGRPLADHSRVADGEEIALGDDSSCSILIGDDALIEICENTRLALERDAATGRRRIRLDAGEIRVVDRPRSDAERIEVHTPAAVATLLGTVVHVAVDPSDGRTTVSSLERSVRVASSRPDVAGATLLTPGEQVTLAPGAAPPASPRRLEAEEITALGGCLVDFHALARRRARQGSQLHALERIALSDGAAAPWGGAGPPAAPAEAAADDLADPADVCSPALCPEPDLGGRAVRGPAVAIP